VVDLQKALKALDGDRALLAECLVMLGEDLPGRMDDLACFIASEDWNKAAIVAHTIKGSVAVVGASAMKEAALGVELAARQEDPQAAHDRFGELRQQWLALEAVIERAARGDI